MLENLLKWLTGSRHILRMFLLAMDGHGEAFQPRISLHYIKEFIDRIDRNKPDKGRQQGRAFYILLATIQLTT